MTQLFISDLHLSADRPDKLALFFTFMTAAALRAEVLYILGDFFDLWIGDDDDMPPYPQIISCLREYTQTGRKIFIAHGNRDFLLGKRFMSMTGAALLKDTTVIDLSGTKTLIMHGDLLCTADTAYLKFRKKVRNPVWQWLALRKNLAERRALAQKIRGESLAQSQLKPADIMDVEQSTVEDYMHRHKVTQIIHGHTHRPGIHDFTLDRKQRARRIVLGDWYDQESVYFTDSHQQGLVPLSTFMER